MYRSLRTLKAAPSTFAPLRASLRPTTLPRAALAPAPIASLVSKRFYADAGSPDGAKVKDGEGAKTGAQEQMRASSSAAAEIKGITSDVAGMISGKSKKAPNAADRMQSANELSSHSHKGSIANDISSITKDLYNEIPTPALVFGLAGTLPYLGTAFGTIFLSREAYLTRIGADTLTGMDAESALQALHLVEHVQITYGAIILSFLGAIHWGMEFSRFQGTFGYSRLALGVIPVLYAWPTTFLAHGTALVAQWFGFTGTWLLDQKASTNGWTPKWYSSYRFYLSMVVGISIMATFAGTNYYGAGAGAPSDLKTPRSLASTESSTMKRLDKVGEKNRPTADSKIKTGKVEGTVKGDFALEEGDESYGKLRNVKAEEEAKKKEEEEKKQKEKEKKEGKKDKKDEGKKDDGKKDEGKEDKK